MNNVIQPLRLSPKHTINVDEDEATEDDQHGGGNDQNNTYRPQPFEGFLPSLPEIKAYHSYRQKCMGRSVYRVECPMKILDERSCRGFHNEERPSQQGCESSPSDKVRRCHARFPPSLNLSV